MANLKREYLEDIDMREFYEFYKKVRRKPSKKIDQYNYFVKAMGGLMTELNRMLAETEHGVHLRGFGVMYKKPFGELFKKLSLFTHKKITRKNLTFYLEDEYLRYRYIITNVPNIKSETDKYEDKADAILLHRKLIKKWKQ